MKIVFLSFYKGIVPRGVETFVDELAERLAENNDITVFQAGKKEDKKYKIVKINIPVGNHRDTSNSTIRRLFLDYWSLQVLHFTLKTLPYLVKEKYDIIIPTNGGWQSFICRIISLLKKSKLVITGQCGPGYDERWNLLWQPNLFVALSTRDELWAKKYLKNVIKIPNGVDLNKFNPAIHPADIPLPKPIVLCVSALTDQKRIDLSISAIAKTDKFNLLVIGSGSNQQKEKISNLGKSLLGDRFLLIEVPHDKISPYYKACDIFTLPSASSEAFGIVLVEAMATNLPVVATDDQVRKEIVGNAGLLCNPENTEEYAKTLQKAQDKNWGDLPRRRSEDFSWDKIASEYESEFKKL